MKSFRGTILLIVVAAAMGGWIWFNERGPIAQSGAEVLWRVQPQSVQNVQLKPASGEVITLQKRGEEWLVSAGKSTPVPADEQAVQSLLEQVQLLQSETTANAETNKLKEFGLDTPQSTLIVDGRTLKFGERPSFDNSKIYAQVENKIALLPTTLSDNFAKPLNDWRDKTVLHFQPEDVTSLEIKAPLLSATFEKTGGDEAQWNIVQPLRTLADSGNVQSFLSQLSTTQTTNFLDDAPKDLAKWGLDKPVARVEVDQSTLVVGKKTGAGYAAKNETSPVVFELPETMFGLINRPLKDWRSKTVLKFNLNDVQRVTLSARGQTKNFVKQNDKWTAESTNQSTSNEAVHEGITDILLAAQGLNAEEFIDKPQTLNNYGLDKPLLEMTTDKLRLSVASRDGKNYARSGANDYQTTIYRLGNEALSGFETGLNILFSASKKDGTDRAKSGKVKP